MIDLMSRLPVTRYDVLDHGFVRLVDTMPRLLESAEHTGDTAVVQAARTSYGGGMKSPTEDRGLIRYLMRHRHTTPYEMAEVKFHMAMPVFVARQFIRHRTANVNEVSARYTALPDRFYVPDVDSIRQQSAINKQGSAETTVSPKIAEQFVKWLSGGCESVNDVHEDYVAYQEFLDAGMAKELARCGLPVNIYTEWYWKCDLHNLFNFLRLRQHSHAQMEIRVYADAMMKLIEPLFPWSCEAFRDYTQHSITLSRLEVEKIRGSAKLVEVGFHELGSGNKREDDEWKAKAVLLGLSGAV